jgi:sulfatase modifying factor 1
MGCVVLANEGRQMITQTRLGIAHIEERLCEIVADELGFKRSDVDRSSRIVQDLGCDSLDLVDLFMCVEDSFDVLLPDVPPNSVYKSVFARRDFRVADFAELVYLQQGTGRPVRRRYYPTTSAPAAVPFSQLGGIYKESHAREPLFEELGETCRAREFRRRTDGMRCIQIPAATVEIGCPLTSAQPDERPVHLVALSEFLIDAEPVSTAAYCRFLNSIGPRHEQTLRDWFVLEDRDDRNAQMLIHSVDGFWSPVVGAERWPMVLVSWFGANAYSLWANGSDWLQYNDEAGASFLPSEAQWEYAARGALFREFPSGNEPPADDQMRFGRHSRDATYDVQSLPFATVNEELGISPFGAHHMGGNVWQWCRDWYDENFYRSAAATEPNAVNRVPCGVRSERGGSWVGPLELCRSSSRRARDPSARGRCLGFRCVSRTIDV